jgi:predicted GNAT family N-acyltransferase
LYQSLGFEQVGDAYDVYGTVHCSMLWRGPQAGST